MLEPFLDLCSLQTPSYFRQTIVFFQCCTAGKLLSKELNLGRLNMLMTLYCMHWNYTFFFGSTSIVNIINHLEVILISKLLTLGTVWWILSFCWFKRKYYLYSGIEDKEINSLWHIKNFSHFILFTYNLWNYTKFLVTIYKNAY